MQSITHPFFLLPFSIGLLGLLTALILFWTNRENILAARLLAGVLIAISILLVGNSLYLTNYFLKFPHLYRLVSAISFCIGPLSFLYVRTSITQSYRLQKKDLLFFIPAVLYQLNRIPFVLLDKPSKLLVIQKALTETKNIAGEPEGWLPVGWAAIFRIIVGMSFIVAQLIILSKWKLQLKKVPDILNANMEQIKWLNWYTVVMLITYGVLLLEMFLHLLGSYTLGFIIVLTIGLNILFIAIYLFTKPTILYGMKGWIHSTTDEATVLISTESVKPIAKRTFLSATEGKEYKQIIESHFAEKKPFCLPGYSIHDLSIGVAIPVYQLSAFINQEYGKNFNELINDYRFSFLQQMMEENPEFSLYTFEALGKLAGFNSRTSFISAIKKRTGKTPSEYFVIRNSEIKTNDTI
jgi:AraC-like DNA-binding protein